MAEAPSQMAVYKSVYVGNIPVYLTEDDLLNIFMQLTNYVYSAKILKELHTGRSRGFGFLVVSEDDAKKLINRSTSENPIVAGGVNLRIKRARKERPFQLKQFIPTPGYNCYKRPPLPDYISYEENEPDKPTIHSLNDDVLLAIIKHLQFKELLGIERVCRRWQFLIYELYRGMSWCFISDDVDNTVETYFEKDLVPRLPTQDPRCDFTGISHYRGLSMWPTTDRKQVVDKILQVVGENLPNLWLSQFRGSYSDSKALAQLVPNLQTLCLSGTSEIMNLSPIIETCKNLTNLFLYNTYINMDVMTVITKCHKLETLSGCVLSVSLLGILPKTIKNLQAQLAKTALDDIVLNIQHLKDLERLSFYRDKHSCISIMQHQSPTWVSFNSKQIKCLTENHKNLKYLKCSTPEEDVDYSTLTRLEHLHLTGSCPLSLFDNLPPKLEVLCIYPSVTLLDPWYSVDLSLKMPTCLHSFFVLYQYLDVESLLTLKDVPSVTKLVVFLDDNYSTDDLNLHYLESLVTIPNLQELFFDHYDLVDIMRLEFYKIDESRKNSLAKVKKGDSNLNQEKHPLLLYGDITSWWKTENEHVKLVSISKPMLDGLVFPYEMMADDDSSISGYSDMMRDQLFIDGDDILDDEESDEPVNPFEFRQMLHHDGLDDLDGEYSDNGGEGLVEDDEDHFLFF